MNAQAARDMLVVIRAERQRRLDALSGIEEEWQWDQWTFSDEPFINEMCLVLLVAIRHLLERELLRLVVRAGTAGPIPSDRYWEMVETERRGFRGKGGWKNLAAKLNLDAWPAWNGSLKTLQLIANTYKHEPGYAKPGQDLLTHLGLDPVIEEEPLKVTYASLAESRHFREALALHLDLPKDADYTAIAQEYLAAVERFVAEVERQPHIAAIRPVPVRLDEFVG